MKTIKFFITTLAIYALGLSFISQALAATSLALTSAQNTQAFPITIANNGITNPYTDVSPNHPNYPAIMYLTKKGILHGYSDGTFRPDTSINRVEALKIILASANFLGNQGSDKTSFKDTIQSAWYVPLVNQAVQLGVGNGYPDGTFKPNNTVNLAEAIKMVIIVNNSKLNLTKTQPTENPYNDASKDQWYAMYFQNAKNLNLLDADAGNNVQPAGLLTRGRLAEIIYRVLFIRDTALLKFPVTTPFIQCGASLNCLVQASTTCSPAKSTQSLGGITGYLSIMGNDEVDKKCVFTTESFSLMQTCKFDQSDLNGMLSRWLGNKFSSTDYANATCVKL